MVILWSCHTCLLKGTILCFQSHSNLILIGRSTFFQEYFSILWTKSLITFLYVRDFLLIILHYLYSTEALQRWEFIKENKIVRKKEKRKKKMNSFFSWSRACFLTFLFSFINSDLSCPFIYIFLYSPLSGFHSGSITAHRYINNNRIRTKSYLGLSFLNWALQIIPSVRPYALPSVRL